MVKIKTIFYVCSTALFISACGGDGTQTSKATTPEAGIVKLICQCQESLIQGQGSSKKEAESNALKKCQAFLPQATTVSSCEEITADTTKA